jgi:hypothetical protein
LAVKVFTAPIDTPSSSARQLLKVTAGSMQSCALTLGGALYGCGLPTTDGKAIEVSAGVGRNFMCGLEANAVDRRDSGILGLLGATGELMRGKVVAIVKMPTRGPTSIGASMFNACATFEVGLVACSGNWHDMLFAPHPVEGLLVARAISVNVNRACVLTAHDEV